MDKFFELMMFIIALTMIVLIISKKNIKHVFVFSLLAISDTVFLLQIIFGNVKWQLFPLYIAIVLLSFFLYLSKIKNFNFKKILRRTFLIFSSFFVIISLMSVLVFPLYEIPSPSGDYLVGTESFIIEDNDRNEIYTDQEGDYRKFKIQIWYPAETTDGYVKAPWLEDGKDIARGLSKDIGLPIFMLDHTASIQSNSYLNAPISQDESSFPVIILSHGWRGFRNLHTDYAEELASLGYIVIGIDHTYGSVATVFEDEVVYVNLEALPERETTPNFLEYANRLVSTYAGDISKTLDYIEVINQDDSSRFQGYFDLNNIGLIGHSTGGGAGVKVALVDDRIKAIIGLDAWVEPIEQDEIALGLDIPSLFLRSEMWETGLNNDTLFSLIDNSQYLPKFYQIDGTTHYDFAMVYMYSPLTRSIGFSGDLDSDYLNNILKSFISDFFNDKLKNLPDSQTNISVWEEVKEVN